MVSHFVILNGSCGQKYFKILPILLISLPFEFLGPVPGKFMVGVVGHFTLQRMARTNHKSPGYRRRGIQNEAKHHKQLSCSVLSLLC